MDSSAEAFAEAEKQAQEEAAAAAAEEARAAAEEEKLLPSPIPHSPNAVGGIEAMLQRAGCSGYSELFAENGTRLAAAFTVETRSHARLSHVIRDQRLDA